MSYSIGVDYGTNSVRALVVDCTKGHKLAVCVAPCPPVTKESCSIPPTTIWPGKIPAITCTVGRRASAGL